MSDKNAQGPRPPSTLSPRQVADAIGVSVSSLKRWCDRGDLATIKTAGGHRRIPRAAVVQFMRARGYEAKEPDLLGLPAGSRLAPRERTEVLPQVVESLFEADEEKLSNLLTGLYLAKKSFADISDDYLAPAFEAVGHSWQCGELEVYQEHEAVVLTERVLGGLRGYLEPVIETAPMAMMATLSRDIYTLPISLIELTLRELGWNTKTLGPNHPVETLESALLAHKPRAVCISISYVPFREEVIRAVNRLADVGNQQGTAVIVGGGAVDSGMREQLRCTAFCQSMRELVSLARGLEPFR